MADRHSGQRPFSSGEKITVAVFACIIGFACLQSCGSDDDESTSSKDRSASTVTGSDRGDTHTLPVTSARFTEWPFTVSAGTLRCRPGDEVTFTAPNGTEYAVNGTAKGAGYPSIEPIWADDENLGHGLKVDISEVLAKGRSLC
ncbi:DUF2511 domain-containing protein [Streptomyces sp. SCL15-4]|uniref:DUF2511 domain-containing protein n=1 Tax=Streptomyces sp. SCL15-4 TaxID=2967221 RepID=UPI00296655F7|nr:DUF2511 domain-containing protein [Streptomyces sp. SCL15-4]